MSALDTTGTRLHYIDWLRVLAVLLLFPYHVTRVFNEEAFYVKADEVSAALNVVLGFVSVWHMPLLFLLAGASTYFALRRRSARQYLGERFTRLGVPFLIGVFILLIPVQTWYGARFNSGYTESFWHYLVSGDFLQWNIQEGGDYFGGFGFGHLWFIFVLLLVAVIALPLLANARTRRRAAPRPLPPPGPARLVAARGAAHLRRRGPAGPDRRPGRPSTTSSSSCSGTSWSATPPS